MRLMLIGATGLALMGLSGCATMSQEQCVVGDWYGQGRADGAAGRGAGRLGEHAEACAKYGVTPIPNAYYAGHEQGVRQYCMPGRGFRVAASGGGYSNGFCPADLERDFLYAYSDGRLVWDAAQRASNLRSQANDLRARAERYERDIRDAEYRLANEEGLSNDQRRNLRDRINRMRRDRDVAVDQANEMAYDITGAEREVSHLRARFTPIYGNF